MDHSLAWSTVILVSEVTCVLEEGRYPNVVAAALPLNPEPWAMGNVAVITAGRKPFPKVSPNKTLKTYQDAVQAELEIEDIGILPGPFYSVRFTFSRQLVKYKTRGGKTSSRNWADVTNMQKGTEDALQGVRIPNDRAVVRVQSGLYGPQRESTLPFVVIEIRHSIDGYSPRETAVCHSDNWFSPEGQEAWEAMLRSELGSQDIQDNEWSP